MTVLSSCKFLAAAAAVVLPASSMFAAAAASDNAGNYSGSYVGSNKGTGFGTFILANGNDSGTFLGSSTGNGGGSGGIDTGGQSFGLYSSNGGYATVSRSFTTGGSNNSNILGPGQSFSLTLDNGYVSDNNNIGFNLVDAGGTLFNFNFKGATSDYTYNGADSGVGYTTNGLSIVFTEGTNNAYTLKITPTGGATTTLTGTLSAADITGFQVYNSSAGAGGNYDLFFNSVAVNDAAAVPEPFTSTATGLLIGVAAFKIARRRKKGLTVAQQ